ncbi:MAG: DUF2860 family protein [Deltaproteobacteria bacterium]|nr:MAG: DUF2860 family protein [Deltaproteobacteria bacterium]
MKKGVYMMKLRSLVVKIVLVILLCLCTSLAYAQPTGIPQESGFSGFVNAGGALWRVENNMVKKISYFQLGDDKIGSYRDNPKSEYAVTPILNFNLRYTFASTRTQIFLGNQLEDLLRLDTATLIGVKQELPDQSVIGVSYIYSALVTEVYKDPYDTTGSRSGTERNINGVRLSYENILSTDLSFQYTYRNIDIDSERSGRQLVSDGVITNSEADRLIRDGDQHDVEFLYRYVLEDGGAKHTLIPSFKYSRFDLDGDAMSNNAILFNLNYRYDVERFAFVVNGYYGYADYDERNPIYNKTRNEDRYGFGIIGFYKRFLDVQGLALTANVLINRQDSNIDFYDSEIDLYFLSVLYHF